MAGLDELLRLIGLGTPFVYAAGAYGLFRWLDHNISDEARIALSRFIELKSYDLRKVSASLVETFDLVYTHPLFSFRAFLRSALITVVVSCIYVAQSPQLYNGLTHNTLVYTRNLGPSIAINIFNDFVCLFVIRRWLAFAGHRPIFALLACVLAGVMVLLLTFAMRLLWFIAFSSIPRELYLSVEFVLTEAPFAPIFALIPAVIVFVWLPLFGVAIGLVKLWTLVSPFVSKLQWFLKDGKDHPLIAIGYAAALVVFVTSSTLQYFYRTSSTQQTHNAAEYLRVRG
jgi:hypothetical protein